LEFEWHDAKAEADWQAHGVRFELAVTVFEDPFAIDRIDDREDYGEKRFRHCRNGGGASSPRKTTTSDKMLRPMTPEAIEAAARADPDAQPLSEADLKRMKRTPQAKVIRRSLDLTQEEFADRYHIPLGTLRDWEQGRAEPDQPARAYLTLIARDPDRVNRILNRNPR